GKPRAPAPAFAANARELLACSGCSAKAEGQNSAAGARFPAGPPFRRPPARGRAVGPHARAHALGLARLLPVACAPARLPGQPGAGRAPAQVAAPPAEGAVGGAGGAAPGRATGPLPGGSARPRDVRAALFLGPAPGGA